MQTVGTTRLSSRGQIVIPEEIRGRLKLAEGTSFAVFGMGDTVILKSISPPSKQEFGQILTAVRKQAKKAGIRQSDVKLAIAKVRTQK